MSYDYLKEIAPFYEYVTLYHAKRDMPSRKVLLELSYIYDDLREAESKYIYGKAKAQFQPVDLSCSKCIREMMKHLRDWKARITERNTVEFKGVPQREENPMPDDMLSEAVESLPSVKSYDTSNLDKYVDPNLSPYEKTLYPKMKWGEFKTYCKGLGLNTKGKKRIELEEELKMLPNSNK